jgi:hypothetical protein
MNTMEGLVKVGLAMFLTWRTGFSCGAIALVGQVEVRSRSIGPTSSTRIMHAITQ